MILFRFQSAATNLGQVATTLRSLMLTSDMQCIPQYRTSQLQCMSVCSMSKAKSQPPQRLVELHVMTTATAGPSVVAAAGAAAAMTPQPTRSQQQQTHQCLNLHTIQVLVAVSAASAAQYLAAGGATAATIEVEVPDFLVENNPVGIVLHSPVFAIGAAVLALLLFPKLIRTTINYVFYPAIAALLAYLAISHPEETASSIYYVLEFIKDHPAASSVAVIAVAGILLGPDVLAGTAVAGVLVLLAAQAGFLQLPKPPELPKLPGQQVIAKQLGKAGKALQERVEELDEGRPLLPAAVFSRQQQWQQQQQLDDYSSSSRGKQVDNRYTQGERSQENDDDNKLLAASGKEEATNVPQQQQQQPLKAAGMLEATPSSRQQRQEEVETEISAEGAFQSLKGLGQKLTTASKRLAQKAREVLPEQEQLQAGLSTAKSGLLSATQEMGTSFQVVGDKVQQSGLGPRILGAGKELGSRAQGLGDKLQQSGLGSRVQDVQEKAGAAAASAFSKLRQGLQQQQVPLPIPSNAMEPGVSQQQQQIEAAVDAADSSSEAAAANGESSSRIDSILANS